MTDGAAVLWFRRDLRLADHPALTAALADHRRIVPCFVWDPVLTEPAGAPRLAFLTRCLAALDADLGGALVVRTGSPVDVLPALVAEVGAVAVYASADFGPYGSRRDEAVGNALDRTGGVPLRRVGSPYAVDPGTLRTGDGAPFRVFTPFRRAWTAHGWGAPLPTPRGLDERLVTGVPSDPGPGGEADAPPGPALPGAGEAAAHTRLDAFLEEAASSYGARRDRPDLDGTTRLSAALRFGCLHPRQILDRLDERVAGHATLRSELCWREFYADVLHHRPDTVRAPFRTEWRDFEVDTDAGARDRFAAWCAGRTGYPFVDAGMRQLAGEAWMHNRVRMVTASFLVKDLHLPWWWGARWFMRQLVDGDLASNQHGWQWTAGCGTDAAPYFRIFNPVTQGRRFDPDGRYVRRWVPELRDLGDDLVHEPWRSPGLLLGPDYPPPLVDHATERRVALARYEALRSRGA